MKVKTIGRIGSVLMVMVLGMIIFGCAIEKAKTQRQDQRQPNEIPGAQDQISNEYSHDQADQIMPTEDHDASTEELDKSIQEMDQLESG